MTFRETRSAWRHFLYFFVCIALGVGALVGVALFASNLERTINREARGLLGGDLEVRLTRLLSDKGKQVLASLARRGIQTLHVTELVAMAATAEEGSLRAGRATQIIELKAVEEGYPFYGAVRLEPDRPLTELLAPMGGACVGEGAPVTTTCHGALVQESLLIRMGLAMGDRLKIGQAIFIITGVIRKEPDRVANLFSLGPRVMISQQALSAAELIKPGSRIRERYLLKLPATMTPQPLLSELRGRLASDMARVSTYRDAQPQLKNFLDQLARYLGLIGLTALFVGGIGVATSVQAFLREKLQTIAILKTLGADSSTMLRTYVLQALFLGSIGSVAGATVGIALQRVLPSMLSGLLGSTLLEQIEFTSALSPASLLPLTKGISLGILTTLLFTLWPLLSIREVRPALIFRRDLAAVESSCEPAPTGSPSEPRRWPGFMPLRDPIRLGTAAGTSLGLAALAIWQAGSWKIGLLFIGGLTLAVGLLLAATLGMIRALKSCSGLITGHRSLALRHAIGNLHRPGSQAAGVTVSIGIAVMVILTVSLLERSLVRQVGESRPADAPTFFFIDIQPDQKDAFVQLIQNRTDTAPQVTPLVRSRLYAINGARVSGEETSEQGTQGRKRDGKSWYFTREYVLTFLDHLPKDNVLLQGRWWAPGERPSKPLVSVEEEAARNLGVDLGSTIEFEIQGTTVAAEVSSIRKVDWGNFSTNFYMIVSPGSLEGAPFTYVGTVRISPEQEIPLQQAVVAAFPNVTAINIVDVMDSFVRILDRLSLAIRAIAVFCMLAGAIVMAAALATTRYRRLYESVILKALGATRGLIARAFATEYALLGAVGGLIGILLACALSWGVMYFIFDLAWTFQPAILAAGLGCTVLLAVAVGFFSTFRLLGQRPLPVLRHE
jgi:putative ABC transport system permease protein